MVAQPLLSKEGAQEYIETLLYELWHDLHHGEPSSERECQNLLDETEHQLMRLVVIWGLLHPSE